MSKNKTFLICIERLHLMHKTYKLILICKELQIILSTLNMYFNLHYAILNNIDISIDREIRLSTGFNERSDRI